MGGWEQAAAEAQAGQAAADDEAQRWRAEAAAATAAAHAANEARALIEQRAAAAEAALSRACAPVPQVKLQLLLVRDMLESASGVRIAPLTRT